MARVLALIADLLFGSRVQAALQAAGHEVELIADGTRLRQRLAEAPSPAGAALLVDLTDAQLDGASLLEELAAGRGREERVAGEVELHEDRKSVV